MVQNFPLETPLKSNLSEAEYTHQLLYEPSVDLSITRVWIRENRVKKKFLAE